MSNFNNSGSARSTQAYPLQWPIGRARTQARDIEKSRFKTTLASARNYLVEEIGRLTNDPAVISTNLTIRQQYGFDYLGSIDAEAVSSQSWRIARAMEPGILT